MRVEDLKAVRNLHHAYIVAGSSERGAAAILEMLAARGVRAAGNPDLLVLSFQELHVDDVRERILPFMSLKALGEKKYLILSFSRANEASQNALLKAIEEPLGDSVFFFSVDAVGHLLPTVRSRCIILNTGGGAPETATDDASSFLAESYEKRLARVEKMVSYVSKNQDRLPVRAFVKDLIVLLHKRTKEPKILRDLVNADRYLRLQGSSVKSILGHLAVSLPRK